MKIRRHGLCRARTLGTLMALALLATTPPLAAAAAETGGELVRRFVDERLNKEGPRVRYQVEETVTEGDRIMVLLRPVSGDDDSIVMGFRIELGEIEAVWSVKGRRLPVKWMEADGAPGPDAPVEAGAATVTAAAEPGAVAPTPAEPSPAASVESSPVAAAPPPATEPASSPQAASTPTESAASGELEGVVLVAGKGKPREFFIQAVEQMIERLAASGVALQQATHGVGYMQDPLAGVPIFLEEVRESGAEGLLFVSTQFGHREYIHVECMDGAGAVLWKERVKGGLGHSKIQMNAALLDRVMKKVEKRLGGPCLPRSG